MWQFASIGTDMDFCKYLIEKQIIAQDGIQLNFDFDSVLICDEAIF